MYLSSSESHLLNSRAVRCMEWSFVKGDNITPGYRLDSLMGVGVSPALLFHKDVPGVATSEQRKFSSL